MAYKLNSAKDSLGDEDKFVQEFAKNQAAIVAYKKAHGGDLEGAFQKVLGIPWPSGRSVKLKDGQPEMTKDRTVKSVIGKYVALPAAIGATAAFAPGALPALAHAAGLGGINAASLGSIGGLASAGKKVYDAYGQARGISDAVMGVGRTIGAATDKAAENRGEREEGQFQRDALALQGKKLEDERRGNAMRDISSAAYMKDWKPANRPGSSPTISFTQAPNADELKGYEAANQSALGVLQSPAWEPAPYVGPSGLERAGDISSNVLGIGGAAMDAYNSYRNRRKPASPPVVGGPSQPVLGIDDENLGYY